MTLSIGDMHKGPLRFIQIGWINGYLFLDICDAHDGVQWFWQTRKPWFYKWDANK